MLAEREVRERGGRAPGEQRRVAAVERRVLAPGLEHVVEPCAHVSRGDPHAAAGVEVRPHEMAAVRDRVELLGGCARDLDLAELESRVDDVRDRVGDPRCEAVLLARLEPVRRVGERLVEAARVQLDERAEGRDERVARDRAARLRVDPRLVPDRLGVGEPVGERVRVDGEDVGGVVLGVERPGGKRLLGAPDRLLARARASSRRRTRGWR